VQQHVVDRHYSLDLKPWSARTPYVYAHADLAQKYSVGLQEIFISETGCAPRKKIFPALILEVLLLSTSKVYRPYSKS
jgi:hypothetical protein